MKQVIELLERAKVQISRAWGDVPEDDHLLNRAKNFIDQAIDELKPRWETPEQYEKRTGEKWPDDAPVWWSSEHIVNKDGKIVPVKEQSDIWRLAESRTAKAIHKRCVAWRCVYVAVCATEAGKPPDTWEPEEAGK